MGYVKFIVSSPKFPPFSVKLAISAFLLRLPVGDKANGEFSIRELLRVPLGNISSLVSKGQSLVP